MIQVKSKGHLCRLLEVSSEQLDIMCFIAPTAYHSWKQLKAGKGKQDLGEGRSKSEYRLINAPNDRLMPIQTRINERILKTCALPKGVIGGVKGYSNIDNAIAHKGNTFIFKTDIERYYDSISINMVESIFLKFGCRRQIARILCKLVTKQDEKQQLVVPQGAPTSSSIANMIMSQVVKELEVVLSEYDCVITAWIDDITISSNEDFREAIPGIIGAIRRVGLKISRPKTCYRKNSMEITGVFMCPTGLGPSVKTLNKLASPRSPQSQKGLESYVKRIAVASGKTKAEKHKAMRRKKHSPPKP